MLKLLTASLFTLVCTTSAIADRPTPAPRAPVPQDTACLVSTVATQVIFQIDRKSDNAKIGALSLAIGSNGWWRYTETRDGKVLKQTQGCLDAADLKSLTTSLAGATWKFSRSDVTCDAIAPHYTQYSRNGKPVYTTRLCDGQTLDTATQKALAQAIAITQKVASI